MDITALATSFSNMKLATQVSTSVLKKTLDVGKENATNLIQDMKSIELSVNPHLGANFDRRI